MELTLITGGLCLLAWAAVSYLLDKAKGAAGFWDD